MKKLLTAAAALVALIAPASAAPAHPSELAGNWCWMPGQDMGSLKDIEIMRRCRSEELTAPGSRLAARNFGHGACSPVDYTLHARINGINRWKVTLECKGPSVMQAMMWVENTKLNIVITNVIYGSNRT